MTINLPSCLMGDDFFSIGLSFLLTAAGFSKTAHTFSFIAFILTNFEEKTSEHSLYWAAFFIFSIQRGSPA